MGTAFICKCGCGLFYFIDSNLRCKKCYSEIDTKDISRRRDFDKGGNRYSEWYNHEIIDCRGCDYYDEQTPHLCPKYFCAIVDPRDPFCNKGVK